MSATPRCALRLARCAPAVLSVSLAAMAADIPDPPAASPFEREILEQGMAVKRVRVAGAVSLPADAIAAATHEYEGRTLSVADVRALAAQLTRLYVDRGFVSSGVVFRSYSAADGEALFDAIEGSISQVRFVAPPRVANPAWLTRQLVPHAAAPARLDDIQERMAALRDAGVVNRINASLEPLATQGLAELVVAVDEPRPWSLILAYDNHHSPVVGARRPSLTYSNRNVTGWGDRIDLHAGHTDGLEDVSAAWLGTVPRTQVLVGAHFERSDALAIDPPAFRSLDLKTLSETGGADLGWRFDTRAARDLQARLAFDRRRSETSLLGLPFSFVAGLPDGTSRADVVRASFIGIERGERGVLFGRAQVSQGRITSALDPVPEAPDAHFTVYFLQGQYARRFFDGALQASARIEGQYTNDRLLPIEKYSLGGATTVRGYRENVILRDRGALASFECLAPVWRNDAGFALEAGAFVDGAWSRNVREATPSLPKTIASAGITFALTLPWGLAARIDVARPSQRWLTENRDIQDRGVHFALTWNLERLVP